MAFDPDDIRALLHAADPVNATARRTADAARELLYGVQAEVGEVAAGGAGLAVALAALGFIREAAGDEAAVTAAGMILGAVTLRQDRVVREARL